MGAKIYRVDDKIKKPTYDFGEGYKVMKAEDERYEKEARAWCKEVGSGALSGEVLSFPHADSAAYYMVISTRPLQLAHLQIGDEWQSEWAELLTVKKAKEMVSSRKAMEKLFPGSH